MDCNGHDKFNIIPCPLLASHFSPVALAIATRAAIWLNNAPPAKNED